VQIRRIQIEGFGIFHDRVIEDIKPGFNLLLGENEAGKSTLLDFLRFTLFGYPHKKEDRRAPLQGGRHGGWLEGALSNGKEFQLYRAGDKKGGNIRLIEGSQESTSQDRWLQLVRPATEDLYKNVYGISLKELWDVDTLSQSGVEERLYSIGLGLGNISLGDVEKAIQEHADQYFKKGGSVQEMPEVNKKMNAKRQEVDQLQQKLTNYQETQAKLDQLEAEIGEKEQGLKKLADSRQHYQNLLSCYEPYVRYREEQEKLDELPSLKELPENGQEEFKRITNRLQELNDENDELIQKKEATQNEFAKITINEDLLAYSQDIDKIGKWVEVYEDYQGQIEHNNRKIQELNQQIRDNLAKLAEDWTEEDVKGVGGLVSKKDQLRQWRDQLQELDKQRRQADANVDQAEEQLTTCQRQEENAQQELDEIDKPAIADPAAVNEKKKLLDRVEVLLAQRQTSGAAQYRNQLPLFFSGMIAAFCLIAATGLFLYDNLLSGLILLLIGVVLLGVVIVWRRSDKTGQSSQEDDELQRITRQLGVEDQITHDKLIGLRKEWEQQQAQLEKWQQQQNLLQDKEKERKEAEDKLSIKQEEKQKLDQEYGDLLHSYQNFLQKHGLATQLTPDGALDAFQTIDQTQKLINDRNQLDEDRQERQGKMQRFEEQVHALATYMQENGDERVPDKARKLVEALEANKKNYQEQQTLKEKLANIDQEIDDNSKKMEGLQKEKQNLLTQAGAFDDEAFHRIYRQNEEVRECQQKQEQALNEVRAIVGYDKAADVLEQLTNTPKEELEEYRDQAAQQEEELKEILNEKRHEEGEQRNQLKMLAEQGDLNDALTELEHLKQRLQNAYEEWLAAQMGLHVLQTTRQRYEKEKQPAVIQKAGGYFRQITDGAYHDLVISLGNHQVTVYTEEGIPKRISELSRGTREQLLLSLRLGLIEEYEENGEPLPVVLDDLLVNFDPLRAEQAARALSSFAQNRQVFFFTCHPQMRELFAEQAVNLIHLSD
jgi:uncharacterized protein YhaN